MYEADDLKKATGDFANDNYLGEGGFSVVYGGTLRRTPVAVKVLKKVLSQYLVHAYYCSHQLYVVVQDDKSVGSIISSFRTEAEILTK